MESFNGLSVVNVELTSRCNKNCFMCGRRKVDRDYPELKLKYGDMDLDLAYKILKQLPSGIVVQFHNNGEPLMYPYLYQVLNFRTDLIRCFDTNAKLLVDKADSIIDNMETLTISVIENDLDGDEQYDTVKEFLSMKGDKKPIMIYRLLGDVGLFPDQTKDWVLNQEIYKRRKSRWYSLPGIVATRILHNPLGSYGYTKKTTVPEIGICLDLLNHLVIDKEGNVFPCVRFNPLGYNLLGNVKDKTLSELWNGEERQRLVKEHIKGNRKCSELCGKCEFWGIPTS